MALVLLALLVVALAVPSDQDWSSFFTQRLQDNQTLSWFNQPQNWELLPSGELTITPDKGSDFWRKTFYEFIHYNGHVLETQVDESIDWVMTTRVTVRPKYLYDLAGLFVRISEKTWLKASTEYISNDEPNVPEGLQVGVVTTNDYSDWSTHNLQTYEFDTFDWRITKTGKAYLTEVRWGNSIDAKNWTAIRLSHLQEDGPVYIGVVATSLTGFGFEAQFKYLHLNPPSKKRSF